MKKIALFCTDLEYGGIQRVVVTLANALQDKGLAVQVILLKGEGALLEHLPDGVALEVLGCSKRSLKFFTPFSPLLRSLANAPADVLVSFGSVCNRIACWTRKLHKIKPRLVVTEHTLTSERLRGKSGLEKWRTVTRFKWLYRYADRCVCVSSAIKEDLAHLGILPPSGMRVIYNPIFDGKIVPLSQEPVENEWFAHSSVPVILWAGRLVKIKRVDRLLRSFEVLLNTLNVKARLILLGEGPLQEELSLFAEELGIKENVHFAGFKANPYAYMGRASLLVLSSAAEGLGNVLIEAMACGTNVVSFDCPSAQEILENGRYGRLVPAGDVGAMAGTMKEALQNPYPKELLQSRAAFFSVERSVNAYLETF